MAVEEFDFIDGDAFVTAISRHGYNEQGSPIRIYPWFREYLLLLGDLRVPKKDVTGSQQCGKTLGCSLFLSYCVHELQIGSIYSYATDKAAKSQAQKNLAPVLLAWEASKGLQPPLSARRNTEIWESGRGGVAEIKSASTNVSTGQKSGLAAAGASNVGFQSDALIDEERSQSPPGARDAFERRLAQSKMKPYPSHVNLGTPGAGLGIELDIQDSDIHFYPFYECPECGAVEPLHPKGCLLQPEAVIEHGEQVLKWFSGSGKPLKWLHHDPEKIINSAYIGCSQCHAELPKEARLNAYFREVRLDLKFDIKEVRDRTLLQYLEELPAGMPSESRHVSIVLSPLLGGLSAAATMIQQLISTNNPADAHQQVLGIPSDVGASAITEEMIRRCIGLAVPDREPDCVLAGGDQGQYQDWVWVAKCWLPESRGNKTASEIAEQTILQLVFAGDIMRLYVPGLLRKHNVDLCVYDSEPHVRDAIVLSKEASILLADQKTGVKYDVKADHREYDGKQVVVYNFRQEDYQNQVVEAFESSSPEDGLPLWRLPDEWIKWLQLRNDDRSPVRHLCSMKKDYELGRWIRPADHIDDHFFAGMFLKLALRLWLQKQKKAKSYVTGKAKW